jgi:hypothetical protein
LTPSEQPERRRRRVQANCQLKPSQAKSSQAKPNQTKPNQTKPSQAKPSQAKPSQAKPSQAKPHHEPRVELAKNDLIKLTGLGVEATSGQGTWKLVQSPTVEFIAVVTRHKTAERTERAYWLFFDAMRHLNSLRGQRIVRGDRNVLAASATQYP